MFPRLRTAFWALIATTAWVAAPGDARADSIHYAFHLTQDDAAGSGGPAAATPSTTLADVAGAATPISLTDLLVMAMRQAPSLQLALIDIEVAEAQIEQLRGLDDWAVGARLVASTSTGSVFAMGTQLNYTRLQAALGADLTRLLPSGGSVSLHAETGWGRASDDAGAVTEYTDSISASWVQPLLRGRGRDIARASQAQARITRTAVDVARTSEAIDVVNATVIAYWDLVLALRDLDIRRSSLQLAGERLRITQAAIRGGKVAATEALAVEQVIATREEEILGAELTVLDRSIELRRLVGMEIGPGQMMLTTETDLGVPSRAWDLDELVGEAYRTSPQLALIEAQEQSAEIEVEVTENGLLPALDLSLTFGPSGRDDSPGKALSNTVTFDEISAVASLSYQQSLGNHAASGRARAARAERQRIRINETDVRADIAQALAQAVVLATSAERRVAIAGRAIELAEQNIVAEQSRFGLGKATNFDVLTRQEELKQAQLRQARAIVDWHKSATVISAISGDLLTRYGISLGE